MIVKVTSKDITNLNKFMLLHSKKSQKLRMISFYAIPFEFILLGIILDGLLKKFPIFIISSAVLGILWFIIFPKFYNKMVEKNIAKFENLKLGEAELNFALDDEKISLSADTTPKPSEIFRATNLNRIVESSQNYFLAFSDAHIVLPKTDEIAQIAQSLSQKQNIKIENVEI